MTDMAMVAQVVRSGFRESVHDGSVVAVDATGTVLFAVGEVDDVMLPRSSNKPLQAAGMVRLGLDLRPDLLAVVGASHSGEDLHVERVRAILAGARLSEDALACPPGLPMDEAARTSMIQRGAAPDRMHVNCSGKHAGMLATCVVMGWPTDGYPDPDHPLQQALRGTVEELAGEPVGAIGVDGCGAPVFGLTPTGLARAFSRLATSAPTSAEGRVADAFRANPVLTSGTTRDENALVSGVPGLVAKAGAEGCYAVALPDGRGVVCKVADGAERARTVVMAEALSRLGVDAGVVEEQRLTPVYGGGRVVGEVVAAGW